MPKKPPGRCIFCNKTGLTNEHVLPDRWMRRIFPRTASDTRQSFLRSAVGEQVRLPLPSRSWEVKQGSIFSLWLHIVCRDCNNRWMHDLEDTTGPLLLTLIGSRPGRIPNVGQHLLARWLIKTTMVAEYMSPENVTFSPDDRRKMRNSLQIPKGCQIWIGTTTGLRWRKAIEHVSSHGFELIDPRRPHAPPITLGNAQVTFFGLNTFLAIVFSSSAGAIVQLKVQGECVTGLQQIWPIIHPLMKFPTFPLRDEEIDAAHSWFERMLNPPVKPP